MYLQQSNTGYSIEYIRAVKMSIGAALALTSVPSLVTGKQLANNNVR